MRTAALRACVTLIAALTAAMWVPSVAAASPGKPPPNILLLMAEDMSPRVGAFGDTLASTPNLDSLARKGVVYRNTFTTAGVCAPSRAAHILGRHQIATGTQHMRTTRSPFGSYRAVPPPDAKAYPELLRAAGYYTYTDTKLDYQFSGTFANSGPFTVWSDEGTDTHWRNRPDGTPFFGFISFLVTHESGIFRPLGHWPHGVLHLAMQLLRAWQEPSLEPAKKVLPGDVQVPPYYPDTPTVRADMARHYNNIGVMDQQVGEILGQLARDGLLDSTIVIWTTDHGDGLPRAKRELFDSGIHVPMIIYWPPAYRPQGVAPGTVDERLISFVDFAPTILSLAGVELPANLPGVNFASAEQRAYVYAARDRIDEVPDRQRAVRDKRYKYIRSWQPSLVGGHELAFRDNIDMMLEMQSLYREGKLNDAQQQWFEPPGAERLFDTDTDPFELNSVVDDPAYADVLQRMRGALDAWLAATPDYSEEPESRMVERFQPQGETPVTPAPEASIQGVQVVLSATDNASIGYRLDGAAWQVYAQPFAAKEGARLRAKAVRYGWEESEEIDLIMPPATDPGASARDQ